MRTRLRSKITLLFMTCALLLAIPAVALADGLEADADDLVAATPHGNNATANQQPGTTVYYDFSSQIKNTGNDNNDVFPGTVDVSIARAGDWLASSAGTPSSFSFTGYDSPQAGKIGVTVPCNANTTAGSADSKTMTATLTAGRSSNGRTLSPDSHTLSYTITASGAPAASCTPTNNAPTVSTAAADANGNEGSELTTNGAFSDADGNTTLTISKQSGAGEVSQDANGAWSWSHTPNDNGSGTVVVQATDGTATVTDSFDWSAANVAPTATFNSPDVDEGSDINLSLTDPSDPSSVDTAAGFTYAFDCGSGYGAFGSANSANCSTNDNGTRSVGAKIKDKDGDVTESTASVTISNVAPVLSDMSLSGNTGTACLSGNTVSLSFSFTDVGFADTHTGTIQWGDGSADTPFTTSPQNVQHSYGAGTYTIKVTVIDDDNDSDSDNTGSVSKLYNMSAIQPPFNPDGNSTWKYGSTIPVKVKITDCNNQPVSGLAPKVGTNLANAQTPIVTINEDVFSTSGADTGNEMRFDASAGQYIYNFNSKSKAITDQNATYWMSVKGLNTENQVVTDAAQVIQKFGIKSK